MASMSTPERASHSVVPCVDEPFRARIEDPHASVAHRVGDAAVLGGIVGGIQAPGLDAEMAERRHLIAHQRDQRRDDEGQALAGQRRQLVAERLAGARRHDGEHVPAGQHRAHDLLLSLTEGREAEDVVENLAGVGHRERVPDGVRRVNATPR